MLGRMCLALAQRHTVSQWESLHELHARVGFRRETLGREGWEAGPRGMVLCSFRPVMGGGGGVGGLVSCLLTPPPVTAGTHKVELVSITSAQVIGTELRFSC